MQEVSLFMDIEPQAWQRPKTRVVGGFVKHYSPKKTKDYEQIIAQYYESTKKVFFDKDVPLRVSIYFGMPVPKSTSQKKAREMCTGYISHTKRPDVDNLAKAVLDALNGAAWADDAQIVQLNIHKDYTSKPSIYLSISEVER